MRYYFFYATILIHLVAARTTLSSISNCVPNVNEPSTSAYIQQFNSGPCTPIILIPGYIMSKLSATIDCEKLYNFDAKIFDACGWGRCGTELAPKSSYLMWVTEKDSPMNIGTGSIPKNSECWAKLMKPIIRGEGDDVKIESIPGVSIYPTDTDSMENGQCGVKSYSYSSFMKPAFDNSGYRNGITFQTLPYDWRIGPNDPTFKTKFAEIIKKMKQITGKKVNIYAFSLGNTMSIAQLQRLSPEFKDSHILRVFSVGGPILGSLGSFGSLIKSNPTLIQSGEYSLDSFWSEYLVETLASRYALVPRFNSTLYSGERWYKEAMHRWNHDKLSIDYESDYAPINLFPKLSSNCLPEGVSKTILRDSRCYSNLYDVSRLGSILDTEMTTMNIRYILDKYSYIEHASKILDQSQGEFKDPLVNPGVEMVMIYSAAFDTQWQYYLMHNPKTRSNQVPERMEMNTGDGVVPSAGITLPFLKWASESLLQTSAPNKTVQLVEVCGIYSMKDSVYNSSELKTTRTGYYGIDCSCKKSSHGCTHEMLALDTKVTRFILNSCFDEQKSEGIQGVYKDWDDKRWDQFIKDCELLN